MYVAIVPLTKISIIFLYLRIFRGKSFIYFAYALIAANVAYFLAFEAISIFQCWPINGAWRAWDGSVKATCRNVNLQGWMSATFSIILDVLTLILPLPSLYKLEMSMKKRIQIMMMFSVGVLYASPLFHPKHFANLASQRHHRQFRSHPSFHEICQYDKSDT